MKKVAIALMVLWTLIILPGMILGYLWSGDIPIWPPVVSGTARDFVDWVALFLAGYGVPAIALILFLIDRQQRKSG